MPLTPQNANDRGLRLTGGVLNLVAKNPTEARPMPSSLMIESAPERQALEQGR